MYMNLNYNYNIEIIDDNLKKYTRKMDKEFIKIFNNKNKLADSFLSDLIINIYFLGNKQIKNKLINVVNAIQILNVANDIEDEIIYIDEIKTANSIYKKYTKNSIFLTSQYYYNYVFKIFYENYPEIIGIIQKIIEYRINAQIALNKNIYNSKITIPQYMDILNKKWGQCFELVSLITAYISRLNKDKTKIIKEFSNTVGIAYGINKSIGELEFNIKQGIPNLPTILMFSKTQKRNLVLEEFEKGSCANFELIQEEIVNTNSIDESKNIIKGYLEHSLKLINDIDGRQGLKKLVYDYFLN
jgi:geranylgeranyl pyrophosphate synthase